MFNEDYICSFYGWKKICQNLGRWCLDGWTWVIGCHTGDFLILRASSCLGIFSWSSQICSCCQELLLISLFSFPLFSPLKSNWRWYSESVHNSMQMDLSWSCTHAAVEWERFPQHGNLWMGWWFLGRDWLRWSCWWASC